MKFDIKKTDVLIDVLDFIIGVTIIVVGLLALHRADLEGSLFPLLFFLGTVMFLLNAFRIRQKHKYLALFFLVIAVFLAVAFVVAVV